MVSRPAASEYLGADACNVNSVPNGLSVNKSPTALRVIGSTAVEYGDPDKVDLKRPATFSKPLASSYHSAANVAACSP
jgi:hypothetical protein